MNNKFVVSIKDTNTYVSYNYNSGKLRFLKGFTHATHFETLKKVDLILCEDTRRTRKLSSVR